MASAPNTNPLLEYLDDGKAYELDFGDTWNSINDGNSSKYAYHTIKYDFKPASVAKSEQAELNVGSTQDVSITLPNVEGSLTQSTKFSGNTKSYTPKECLMIIDPQTGKIVLERLSANVRVKNVRMENRTVNPPIKPAVPRANVTESLPDKKPTKPTIATTTTLATATTISKPITQKVTNPSKPIVNAPVKPMPAKRTLSPTDDRLSDEESSPDPSETVAISVSTPAAPVQTNVIPRRSSHTTLEQDLQLSDTSDEEN
ncbi:unnamed protein product [Rotaria magnacalcarata]|uniref:Transcription elongation factor Eaf N-terminal domain-containing protein n=3 Tax=Rotaria magnacalcarata TaxID=392030 RepID=A0A815G4K5_9BILA|nr:unnamed protein product [Rotaria magnacalcarata]CAF1333930.1 unnamed protein product [Rotaria magnacalcarata]CAF2012892.1 unnamed protein product [Rotaria magnacalcarata]CAF2097153.1 unnamed protein product [Rotaria magnacalcarata]CAF2208249.1 unnamed protein product [Rotaria magnacalcarata]